MMDWVPHLVRHPSVIFAISMAYIPALISSIRAVDPSAVRRFLGFDCGAQARSAGRIERQIAVPLERHLA
jgi:hypothetical protein